LLDRPWFRWIGVLGALGAGFVNQIILVNDYPGAHLYLAWAAAACGGAAIAGLDLPRGGAAASRPRRRAVDIARGALASPAAYTMVVWPRSSVLLVLYKVPGAVVAPFLTPLHALRSSGPADVMVPAEAKEWFTDRSHIPDIPPTAPPPSPFDRVIL